jgi:aldehyde:ferredoxin oxidoreductase
MNVEKLKEKRKVLAEISYEPSEVDKGYANHTLYVNVSENRFEIKPVTKQMKDLMIGGRGFNLWLLWNATNKDTKWDSPENEVCIAGGPLCGTPSFPGSGKCIAATISPLTGTFVDSNVGGHFGPLLKFSGFDAIEIQGKAEKDVIIVVNSQTKTLTIEEAEDLPTDSHVLAETLTEMYANDEKDKQNMAIVSAGSGSDHSRMGCLNVSFWDWRKETARLKQAGRGGVGSVFRNKNIKAIVAKTPPKRAKWVLQERWAEPQSI